MPGQQQLAQPLETSGSILRPHPPSRQKSSQTTEILSADRGGEEPPSPGRAHYCPGTPVAPPPNVVGVPEPLLGGCGCLGMFPPSPVPGIHPRRRCLVPSSHTGAKVVGDHPNFLSLSVRWERGWGDSTVGGWGIEA